MNPFFKYLGEEDKLHHSIIVYVKTQFPKAIIAHPTNEGRRTPFERFKISWLGLAPGLPDLLIFSPSNGFSGLAIECKSGKNKMTDSQLKWHEQLFSCGWQCCCVRDLDSAIDIIDTYFQLNKTKHGSFN